MMLRVGFTVQTAREGDLSTLQESISEVLNEAIALGNDVKPQSNSALMEILTVNMHSLQLARDDSMSIQNLALDLAPALALDPNSQVCLR
jgi:hypothetical protein